MICTIKFLFINIYILGYQQNVWSSLIAFANFCGVNILAVVVCLQALPSFLCPSDSRAHTNVPSLPHPAHKLWIELLTALPDSSLQAADWDFQAFVSCVPIPIEEISFAIPTHPSFWELESPSFYDNTKVTHFK